VTYSIDEASNLLGVSRVSLYNAAKAGELPTVKFGKRILVPRAALEQMLAGPTPKPAT
jgi:excisionase family DNA binding protein